jgi:acetylornithine deacetylase/succinyl-diaminopimelate desuccinylase-like protein
LIVIVRVLAVALGLALPLAVQPAAPRVDDEAARRLFARADVAAAVETLRAREPAIVEDQVALAEIPAPPFKEATRAEAIRRRFVAAGLSDVRIDAAGNVLGVRRGRSPRPHVVISAHVDTVFPEGTDVRVTRTGTVLKGPGIGDDARGLAVLVAVARALASSSIQTAGTVTFAATVGEEGLGDIRGARHLVNTEFAGTIDAFVSIDGVGLDVTNVGVGSRRYKATFSGPGGHSYGAFGTANPIHALGRAIAAVSELTVPASPRTTFNVGRIGGGTSVNAIPFEAWFEIDLRSADVAALTALDTRFRALVDHAVAAENARWGRPGQVSATLTVVGDRPAGSTAETTAIVRAARSATAAIGERLTLREGSTDANAAMSRGIPALTIDAGGSGSGAHALDERFDSTDSWKGTVRAFLLTLVLAGA